MNLQYCAMHWLELPPRVRQVCFGLHKRGRGIGRVGGGHRRVADAFRSGAVAE
jgi:hypothetical protein